MAPTSLRILEVRMISGDGCRALGATALPRERPRAHQFGSIPIPTEPEPGGPASPPRHDHASIQNISDLPQVPVAKSAVG